MKNTLKEFTIRDAYELYDRGTITILHDGKYNFKQKTIFEKLEDKNIKSLELAGLVDFFNKLEKKYI